MHLYKLAALLLLNIVFVQAWYTTVVENGTTIVRTKSRSRRSTATSSSTATLSPTTTTTSRSTTTSSSTTTTSSPTTTTSSPTTTTSSSTTTTSSSTTTTSAAVSSPTYTLDFYDGSSCSGDIIQSSDNDGCFNAYIANARFSVDSTSSSALSISLYYDPFCGELFDDFSLYPNTCSPYSFVHNPIYSYSVETL